MSVKFEVTILVTGHIEAPESLDMSHAMKSATHIHDALLVKDDDLLAELLETAHIQILHLAPRNEVNKI